MKLSKLNWDAGVAVVMGVMVIVMIMGTVWSEAADASGWSPYDTVDEMEDIQTYSIGWRNGDQAVLFICNESNNLKWYQHRMVFGQSAYIGSSGGVSMRVRYGALKAKDEDGWFILEGFNGKLVERTWFTSRSFKKAISEAKSSGTVRYRVTAYDKDQFELSFRPPSAGLIEMFYEKCGFN